MELTIPDYAILSMTAGGALVGLFVGFSGAIAFLSGFVASVFVGRVSWVWAAAWVASPGMRSLVSALAALLAFGLVRLVVRKCVHGLVAQPGDALFGLFFAALAGGVVSLGVVWGLGLLLPEHPQLSSVLLERVLAFVSHM